MCVRFFLASICLWCCLSGEIKISIYIHIQQFLTQTHTCMLSICYTVESKPPDSDYHITSPVGNLIESFGISYHQFADDTQLFVTMNTNDAAPAMDSLAHCSAAVRSWFLHNGLQLNPDKSEVGIVGTLHQLRSAATISTIDVASSRLPVSDQLKSLSVTIDSHLRFDSHASNVVRACNYHT